jgi:hypothetical protein
MCCYGILETIEGIGREVIRNEATGKEVEVLDDPYPASDSFRSAMSPSLRSSVLYPGVDRPLRHLQD